MGKINKGFTLVETLVIIAIIGLSLPAVFAIFFSIIQQQVRIYRLTEVKRQGDYSLSIIQNLIRNNAQKIYRTNSPTDFEICSTTTNTAEAVSYFTDKSNNRFSFSIPAGSSNIASVSASFQVPLTNDKVRISNFEITCNRSSTYSTPYVNLSYEICYSNSDGSACTNEPPSFFYSTKLKLKNY